MEKPKGWPVARRGLKPRRELIDGSYQRAAASGDPTPRVWKNLAHEKVAFRAGEKKQERGRLAGRRQASGGNIFQSRLEFGRPKIFRGEVRRILNEDLPRCVHLDVVRRDFDADRAHVRVLCASRRAIARAVRNPTQGRRAANDKGSHTG
jgi:hypothetical protein